MINRQISGRPKGSKDLKTRKQRKQKSVMIGDVIYENAYEASESLGITATAIRRKCKDEKIFGWEYII